MLPKTPMHHENQAVPRVQSSAEPTAEETTKQPNWVRRQIAAMQYTDSDGYTWWDPKEVIFRAIIVVPVGFAVLLLALGVFSWATASVGQEDDYAMVSEEVADRLSKAETAESRFRQVYRDTLEDQLGVSAEQIDEDLVQARNEIASALSLSYGSTGSAEDAVEVDIPEDLAAAEQVIGDWQNWHIVYDPEQDHRYTVLVEFVELSDESARTLEDLLAKHSIYDLDPISLGSEVLQGQQVQDLMQRQTGQRWVMAAEFTTALPGEVSWVRTTWMDGLPKVAIHEAHRQIVDDEVPEEATEHDNTTTEG